MCDTSRQSTDAFKLLRLSKLALQVKTVRNVDGCRDRTLLAVNFDQLSRKQANTPASVLFAKMKFPVMERAFLRKLLDDFFSRNEDRSVHSSARLTSDDFITPKACQLFEGTVHVQVRLRAQIDNHDSSRV